MSLLFVCFDELGMLLCASGSLQDCLCKMYVCFPAGVSLPRAMYSLGADESQSFLAFCNPGT